MQAPLKGITVIEMSTYVAAPVTARLLSDMGADVIKIERPEGDPWRQTGKSYLPLRFSDEENPVFDIYNSGKRHVALNVKTEEGMQALHRLLERADVFVTNTRPAALERLGLDAHTLREKYPALVYAILLGYGERGPDAAMPAFDTSAFWARSGFLRDMSLQKENYDPVQAPYSIGDTVSGYVLTMEICSALYRRERTGLGDVVKSGLFHNSIFTMGTMQIITQPPFGRVYPTDRQGWDLIGGSYECSDGEWVFLSGYSSALRPLFYKMIEREDLNTDERFATPLDRWERRYEFFEIIRGAFLSKPSTHWLGLARELDLPLVRMGHFSDLSSDEQAWANGYVERVTFASGRQETMPATPIEMESVGTVRTVPAPPVGADTEAVLSEIGYTAPQILHMEQIGAAKIARNKK